MALEDAIKTTEQNANVLLISATLKKLRTIVKPAFNTILQDCPDDLKPVYKSQDSVYELSNGARINLCAFENGAINDIRGIHKVISVYIDEASFFGEEECSFPLDYVIDSILTPMFIRTKSVPRIILLSTPPEVPQHPFELLVEKSKLVGCNRTVDLYHSDIPESKIREQRERCKDEDVWQREYMCQFVANKERLVVPEYREEICKSIVKRDDMFRFYDKYTCQDIGGSLDAHGILYAYWDFKKAKLVIMAETLLAGQDINVGMIAKSIKENELKHFNGMPTWLRISDIGGGPTLNTLNADYALPFNNVVKEDLLSMVSKMREWIRLGRVLIDPSCKHLLAQLKTIYWSPKKDAWARSSVHYHFDLVAALMYLIQSVNVSHNPIPADFNYDPTNQVIAQINDPYLKLSRDAKELQKLVEMPSVDGEDTMPYPTLDDPSDQFMRNSNFSEIEEPK